MVQSEIPGESSDEIIFQGAALTPAQTAAVASSTKAHFPPFVFQRRTNKPLITYGRRTMTAS